MVIWCPKILFKALFFEDFLYTLELFHARRKNLIHFRINHYILNVNCRISYKLYIKLISTISFRHSEVSVEIDYVNNLLFSRAIYEKQSSKIMTTNETDASDNYSSTFSTRFAILISFEIPSILISLVIFIYFAVDRRTRARRNHSILLLLTINFFQVLTDLPMPISYFRLKGFVQPATSAYCIWWTWYEFSLNTINGWLMAWISIERHLLIFHSHSIQNLAPWKQKLLHTAPLISCTVWGPLYYLLTIVISPVCTNQWRYDSLLCGLPCYLLTNFGTFDLFFDIIIPVSIIFLSNLALFLRIVYRNTIGLGRIRNRNRRHRKMAFQLGLISFVYLVVWMPLSILQLGLIYVSPTFLLDYFDISNFLVYIVPLILPMIYLMSLPELWKKVKNIVFPQRHAIVRPLNITQAPLNQTKQSIKTIIPTRF